MTRLVVVLGLVAGGLAISCSATKLEDVSCPDGGTTLTYDNFGQQFFTSWCNRCHSAAAGQRHGAPITFVFNTLARVREHKSRIFERAAADNHSMPPDSVRPSRKEREKLAVWLACGAP